MKEKLEAIDKDKQKLYLRYNNLKKKYDSLLGIALGEALVMIIFILSFYLSSSGV